MKKFFLILFSGAGIFFLLYSPALATQPHGAPEGLYVHQLSHLFFVFSMTVLIYWLRMRNLVREIGWRYIQYAAFFFILWTLDAFAAHMLDEQFEWVKVTRVDPWHLCLDASHEWISIFYYLIKLDHLLCVPAIVFLYAGLKRLSASAGPEKGKGKIP
ncbi:MAG: hypothetical protein R2941_01205 [Desulfobacterales bacterium]